MSTTSTCSALIAAIGDAVVVCDANGAIVLWNPAAERLFGYTEAEALGQSLDMIIPERLRKRHWDGYDKTMADRRSPATATTCCACRRCDKDGRAHVDRLHRRDAASRRTAR